MCITIWIFSPTCDCSLAASLGDAKLVKYVFNQTYADAKNAHCLDGSPAGFFWSKGTQSKMWTIHLEGMMCTTEHTSALISNTPSESLMHTYTIKYMPRFIGKLEMIG